MTFKDFKKEMLKLYEYVPLIEPPSDERMLELYLTQVVISNFERKSLKRSRNNE